MPNTAMRTEWNLGLLYKGHDDAQIEKDVRDIEDAHAAFEKKYKGKKGYLSSDAALVKALKDYAALSEDRSMSKPIAYFHFSLDLNTKDDVARARSNQITERITKCEVRVAFFELGLGTMSTARQKSVLASKALRPYRYFLSHIFKCAKHCLSESEERIMSLKSQSAHDLWIAGTDKLIDKSTVRFKDKDLPMAEATNKIGDLPIPDRQELHEAAMKTLEGIIDVAESELNAIVLNKKINDELRGYENPYDATVLGYQNDAKSVRALVDAVTRNYPISHRFYKLKAKIMGLEKLRYSDRNAGIGYSVARKVPFTECVTMLRDVLSKADTGYVDILDSYLANGQIDVYPRQGKTGGAYCWGSVNRPTFVLLNHTDNLDQASTFAHEMGHAIHTELSKSQPAMYQGYSTSTAEVASTFFESLMFDHVLGMVSDKEKIELLHSRINDDIQTIFRQIACFNFEEEMHRTIRAKGAMSAAELRALMNKHMSAYMGPALELVDLDGNYLVSWGHIRRFFYVYSYAFGQLISKALYVRYKEDKGFIKKVNEFLSAGGSDTPENIFKSVGIDVTEPSFWEQGLKSVEKDIEMLEKLTKKG